MVLVSAFATAGAGPAAAGAGLATSAVSAPKVTVSSASGGAPEVTYVVRFTTSPRGALAADQGTITLEAPPGTIFPANAPNYNVAIGPTKTSTAISNSPVLAGEGSVVTVSVGTAVLAGQAVTLTISGVTNPAPGTQHLTVFTSSDPGPARAPPLEFVAPAPVTGPTLGLSSDAGGGFRSDLYSGLYHLGSGCPGSQPGHDHPRGLTGDGVP
jgi:hypothetical protein